MENFAKRLNDFLRAARTVEEFLRKEPRGPKRVRNAQSGGHSAMNIWVADYKAKLSAENREALSLLTELREVSSHDVLLKPALGGTSVDVFDVRMRGVASSVAGNLADQHDFGSPDAENAIQSTSVAAKYVFLNHGSKDVISFCDGVVRILKNMVDRAYAENP